MLSQEDIYRHNRSRKSQSPHKHRTTDDSYIGIVVKNEVGSEISWKFKWKQFRLQAICLPKHKTLPGGDKLVMLDGYKHNIFWIFYDFIMSKGAELDVQKHNKSNSNKTRVYTEAWVLGDVFGATRFKAQAINKLYEMYLGDKEEFPGDDISRDRELTPELVRYAFSSTPNGSVLRELLTEILIHHSEEDDVIEVTEELTVTWEQVWTEFPDLKARLVSALADDSSLGVVQIPELKRFLEDDDEDESTHA